MRKFAFAFAVLLLAAGPGLAQGAPSKADLAPDPVLPKGIDAAPKTLPLVAPALAPENILVLDLSTGGRVKILMRPDQAPGHVERIRTLVRQGFYDGTVFHRVIDGFMAQGGDPTGTGQGGSPLPNLKAEFNDLPHVRGAVAMARAGEIDSANSQFYLVFQPTLKLDRNYTVWGRIYEGIEFVDAIEKGEPPANPTKILKASIGADNAPPPAPSTPIPVAVEARAVGSVFVPPEALPKRVPPAPLPPKTKVVPPAKPN